MSGWKSLRQSSHCRNSARLASGLIAIQQNVVACSGALGGETWASAILPASVRSVVVRRISSPRARRAAAAPGQTKGLKSPWGSWREGTARSGGLSSRRSPAENRRSGSAHRAGSLRRFIGHEWAQSAEAGSHVLSGSHDGTPRNLRREAGISRMGTAGSNQQFQPYREPKDPGPLAAINPSHDGRWSLGALTSACWLPGTRSRRCAWRHSLDCHADPLSHSVWFDGSARGCPSMTWWRRPSRPARRGRPPELCEAGARRLPRRAAPRSRSSAASSHPPHPLRPA